MSYGYVTPGNGFTVETWFNRSALPIYSEVFISQQTQNKAVAWSSTVGINGRQFVVYFNTAGNLLVEFRNNAGTSVLSWVDPASTPAYGNDSSWHHFALKVLSDKRTVYIYIDGVNVYGTTLLSTLDWVPGVLAIGGTYAPHLGNFGTFLYNGGLAYTCVWDKAITNTQIWNHYTAGVGGTVFDNDDEVTRLNRLYDFCQVPTNARRFDPPLTKLQGVAVAGVNGLDSVKMTATDASGIVFADGQSIMVYQNRQHRYNRPVIATLSEENIAAPDIGMQFSTDDTKVYNDVRASRTNGGSARLRNLASEDEYGPKVYELKLNIKSDDEMRNAGTWIVERYGEDRLRVTGVTLSAESSDLIQYVAETATIGDRIAFDDMPNNVPDTYMEFVVEAISVNADFREQTWSVGLELSPAELWNVMQVGVSTLGDGSHIAF